MPAASERNRTQPHRGRVCLPRSGTSRCPTLADSSDYRKGRKTGESPVNTGLPRILAQCLNLKPEQSNIFFKLMEERYRQHSTIITTNLLCGAPHNRFNAESIFMRSK